MAGEIATHLIYSAIQRSKDIRRVAVSEPEFHGHVMLLSLRSDDYFHYTLYTYFRRNLLWDVIIGVDLLLGLLMLPGSLSGAVTMWAIGLGVALWVVGLAFLVGRNRRMDQTVSYGIAPEGMFLRDRDIILQIPWKKLKVRRTRSYIYFYYSRLAGIILPKRELTVASWGWLEECVPRRRREK